MTEIILHIGTEKTGSSSIQHVLRRDREGLAAAGFYYPMLFGTPNHMELAVATMDPRPGDELLAAELGRTGLDQDAYRDRLADTLVTELDSRNVPSLILSNEHCHSRLRSQAEIGRLRDLIAPHADSFRILVYLRRQDRLAVSLYSTIQKLGGAGRLFPDLANPGQRAYFSYDRLLADYAAVFGREAVTARIYDERAPGFDVVTDFFAFLGARLPAAPAERQNRSMTGAQVRFLELFNARFPLMREGRINPERGPIWQTIAGVAAGDRLPVRRGEAEAFAAQFATSNEAVRCDWFPDRPALFDDDFSAYPEDAAAATLSEEEIMDFIEAIWRTSRTREIVQQTRQSQLHQQVTSETK